MKKPTIYLLTKGGRTEVLLCPTFIEIISCDEDVFKKDGDPEAEPLDSSTRIELRISNDEFELRFKELLIACRKLICRRESLRDEGFVEISRIIDTFDWF